MKNCVGFKIWNEIILMSNFSSVVVFVLAISHMNQLKKIVHVQGTTVEKFPQKL